MSEVETPRLTKEKHICPRCLEPYVVPADATVGMFCPKCQTISFYGAPVNTAVDIVTGITDAVERVWSCDRCGSDHIGPSIELDTAACACGIGQGRWGVKTLTTSKD